MILFYHFLTPDYVVLLLDEVDRFINHSQLIFLLHLKHDNLLLFWLLEMRISVYYPYGKLLLLSPSPPIQLAQCLAWSYFLFNDNQVKCVDIYSLLVLWNNSHYFSVLHSGLLIFHMIFKDPHHSPNIWCHKIRPCIYFHSFRSPNISVLGVSRQKNDVTQFQTS